MGIYCVAVVLVLCVCINGIVGVEPGVCRTLLRGFISQGLRECNTGILLGRACCVGS